MAQKVMMKEAPRKSPFTRAPTLRYSFFAPARPPNPPSPTPRKSLGFRSSPALNTRMLTQPAQRRRPAGCSSALCRSPGDQTAVADELEESPCGLAGCLHSGFGSSIRVEECYF